MATLFIDRKKCELKLNGEVLICYENGERIATVPLAPLERLIVKGDVSLESRLLAKLGSRNIGVIALMGREHKPSIFFPAPHNDAAKRLTQYAQSLDETICLHIAQGLIAQKLYFQTQWITHLAVQKASTLLRRTAFQLEQAQGQVNQCQSLAQLRGIEGSAARAYFSAIGSYLPPRLAFAQRSRRPPKDPFNALISLAYTLLYSECTLNAYIAGLDPAIGFLHGVDFGRYSLACDLIEPLRPLVDSWVLGLFRQKILQPEHFSQNEKGCLLGKAGRAKFYAAYEQQMPYWRSLLKKLTAHLLTQLNVQGLPALPQRRDPTARTCLTTPSEPPALETLPLLNEQIHWEA